ncbi:hypothetical protein HDIA_3368 [Hartmannibacter diazotrophicus]|uniref:Uncharacterized protein n=1 Tax=Hartmannibacter diazotrophicus TaxID=1482074 RepID=A0A2C9D9P7_9HYPH|nr:hypothetical protein [Hartmannibacter diazotrophicus]SON56909.1 hypothetical protein HDIA_3368 [Hartmannibacter diazotrophicus]
MHDDHHHHDGHSHAHSHAHGHHHHGHGHSHVGPGHNGGRDTTQWQTPHLPHDHVHEPPPAQRDLDLVEKTFVESFATTSDVTSFLRLAGIPFVGVDEEGRRLHLLRVEIEDLTDVGSVVPLLGGQGVRYDPLPAQLASRRRQLAFVYHDGKRVERLDFANARALKDESDASEVSFGQG